MELFEDAVEAAEIYETRPTSTEYPTSMWGFDGKFVVFQGVGHGSYTRVVQRIVSSSLAEGGFSGAEASRIAADACNMALRDGLESGKRYLSDRVDQELRPWTVVESIRGPLQHEMRVGRARIHLALESVPGAESAWLRPFEQMGFDPPYIVTQVDARDRESAHIRALDIFEEAKAVMNLPGFPAEPVHSSYATISPDGHASTNFGRFDRSYPGEPSEAGWLRLGFRGLERAARRDPGERNEWESCTLYAARWHRKACLTSWPSEALAACMTALEALFVRTKSGPKGSRIAEAVAPNFSHDDWTADQLGEWVEDLYRRRNAVMHGAQDYLVETDVNRLLGLVRAALEWASFHLDDDHDHLQPRRACRNLAEATS
jgi:hypothetical protein